MAQTMLRDYLQQTEDALSSGRINDALANCQHILTHFPESLETQRLLGEIYLAQGHLQEAQQTFDWVLTNDPENVVAYCDRALISERVADFDTALDCYQQAYELSRGNSQIRQEFNQLSTKVGQPHFMFSRAGLARLYMRGDLLLQAIQEWETVLAASPDRLDARSGLLEALWREGHYDRAEQLAKQILAEIPTCLKALLLLAHITSARNTAEARGLIQRAEALDPELVMAQGLFSDLIARQPDDPFLALIKKGPIILPEVTHRSPAATAAAAEAATMPKNGTSSAPVSSGPIFGWSSPEPVAEPQKNYQTSPEYTVWSSSDILGVESRGADLQETELPTPPAWLDMLTHREHAQPGDALPDLPPSPPTEQELPMPPVQSSVAPETPAFQQETPEMASLSPLTPAAEDNDAMGWPEWLKSLGATEMDGKPESQQPTQPWMEQIAQPSAQPPSTAWIEQEAEPLAQQPPTAQSPTPAWMDQIAQLSTPAWLEPIAEPPAQQPPAQPSSPAWTHQVVESTAQSPTPTWLEPIAEPPAQQPPAAQPSVPAWMDQIAQPPAQPSSPAAQPSVPAWMDQTAERPAQPSSPAWTGRVTKPLGQQSTSARMNQVDEPANQPTPGTRAEQTAEPSVQQPSPELTSPVTRPPSTAEQQTFTTLEDLEQNLHAQGFVELEPGSLSSIAHQAQEPTLSSALAQFGDLTPPSSAAPVDTTPPTPPVVVPLAQSPQPLWSATPPPVPKPIAVPNVTIPAEPAFMPSYRADALLENELETTMKRPAVRLQPMQQRPPTQREVPSPAHKARSGERPLSSAIAESNVSQRDRLLRGYQHQLAGDYDEAMQEYRIIIRSTPALLDEVISNVRALLKLAPRYSAGYRVLGDAYMRQGEYLQAMEAYNKALSMTKKGKGPGH